MDSVRFGRVLGIGARLAGKTIVQAVDAAASPNPRPTAPPPQKTVTVIPPQAVRTVASAKATSQGVARGSKKFGEALWSPMVRSGKVLWLEVTGVFFGLVAAAGVQGVYLHRAGALANATMDERKHFWLAAAMAIVFGYFCLSSFIRANRKNRR